MRRLSLCALFIGLGVLGCARRPELPASAPAAAEREVVVYTALDREFSEPILSEFTARTGINALPVFDTESTKTVGLANRIRAEASRPRCDVFWNNEILNTLRLKDEGLLQPCGPTEAANYPAQFRDPDGYWHGFAARARVILVNTELVPPEKFPASILDLARPEWKGRAGIAKPLFGTTASHVACLFAFMGEGPARAALAAMKANNILVASGNKGCAEMVAAGQLALGLTDTDDALAEIERGRPVRIVFPDQGAEQMGCLLLPNTLALVHGCPHPAAGVRLIEYLLSAEVEQRLAEGPSGQIPLHQQGRNCSRVGCLADIRTMAVDFTKSAGAFAPAARYIESEFLAP